MSHQWEVLLWDDNPSTIDLLGFDAVVAPVRIAVARMSNTVTGREPATVVPE
jgi:hypothetical protein